MDEPSFAAACPEGPLQQEKWASCYTSFPWQGYSGTEMWTGIQVLGIKESMKLKKGGSAYRIICLGNAPGYGNFLKK